MGLETMGGYNAEEPKEESHRQMSEQGARRQTVIWSGGGIQITGLERHDSPCPGLEIASVGLMPVGERKIIRSLSATKPTGSMSGLTRVFYESSPFF